MLQKSSMLRTAEAFFLNPTKEHYLMDISRSIGIAHTSVKKNIKKMVRLGLIIESVEKKGGRKFPIYKANIDNKTFKKYKIIFNISSILESNLADFIEEKVESAILAKLNDVERQFKEIKSLLKKYLKPK